MEHGGGVELTTQLMGLMAVSSLVAIGARRLSLPYTIAMVITGLGVSFLRLGGTLVDIVIEPELILVAFLSGSRPPCWCRVPKPICRNQQRPH